MKMIHLALVGLLISFPPWAATASSESGMRSRDKRWMEKDAAWIKGEASEKSKHRMRDQKWMKKDLLWHAGESNPDAPWKKREARFRARDAG